MKVLRRKFFGMAGGLVKTALTGDPAHLVTGKIEKQLGNIYKNNSIASAQRAPQITINVNQPARPSGFIGNVS